VSEDSISLGRRPMLNSSAQKMFVSFTQIKIERKYLIDDITFVVSSVIFYFQIIYYLKSLNQRISFLNRKCF